MAVVRGILAAGSKKVSTVFFGWQLYTKGVSEMYGGGSLRGYIVLASCLNVVVQFLLLFGTGYLCGCPPSIIRMLAGAAVSGVFAGISILCPMSFLGRPAWRLVGIILFSWIAFGGGRGFCGKTAVHFVISMALEGVVSGISEKNKWMIIPAAMCICFMCIYISLGIREQKELVSVDLSFKGKKLSLTAMCDSGNTLRDPLTGKPVLVVGADVAQHLTGLTQEQLKNPSETMLRASLPGLHLIPYRTISSAGGLLLALRIHNVRIGSWRGNALVALAPEVLEANNRYQALTGGTI